MNELNSLSERIFGKELNELLLSDLETFFQEFQDENDFIEFKSYRKEKPFNDQVEKVSRSVAAFLNSSGGVIIFGAPVIDKISKKYRGELTPCEIIEKDSLIYKISNGITPLPNGIRIKAIPYLQGCVYIIEVRSSLSAPHQFNGQYPMRLDGQTVPGPHHYVEALFKRVYPPQIEGYILLAGVQYDSNHQEYKLQLQVWMFNLSLNLVEEDLTYYITTNLGRFPGQNPDNQFRAFKVMPLFSYGIPFTNRVMLYITFSEYHAFKEKVVLTLSFGGKKSAFKVSEYTIELGSPINKTTLNIEVENSTFYENIYSKTGSSMEEIIKKKLGRL